MLAIATAIAGVLFVTLPFLGFSVGLFAFSIVSAGFGLTALLVDANYRLSGSEQASSKFFGAGAGGQLLAPVWCFGLVFVLLATGLFAMGLMVNSPSRANAVPPPAPAPPTDGFDPNDKPETGANGYVAAVDESLRRMLDIPGLEYDVWWPPQVVEYQGKKYWGVRVRYFYRSKTGGEEVAERTAVMLGGVVIGWMNERNLGPRSTFTPNV